MYHVDALEFHFSHGWLEGFKSRHDIKTYHHFGESGSIDIRDGKKPRNRRGKPKPDWFQIGSGTAISGWSQGFGEKFGDFVGFVFGIGDSYGTGSRFGNRVRKT
ncbi:hypothetical protein OROGR_026298 [Orobanche gracilis]